MNPWMRSPRRCISGGSVYVKKSADWAYLKWPKGFRFNGCVWEREIADKMTDRQTGGGARFPYM